MNRLSEIQCLCKREREREKEVKLQRGVHVCVSDFFKEYKLFVVAVCVLMSVYQCISDGMLSYTVYLYV